MSRSIDPSGLSWQHGTAQALSPAAVRWLFNGRHIAAVNDMKRSLGRTLVVLIGCTGVCSRHLGGRHRARVRHVGLGDRPHRGESQGVASPSVWIRAAILAMSPAQVFARLREVRALYPEMQFAHRDYECMTIDSPILAAGNTSLASI